MKPCSYEVLYHLLLFCIAPEARFWAHPDTEFQVEPEQWLQRSEAGSSWPSWPMSSYWYNSAGREGAHDRHHFAGGRAQVNLAILFQTKHRLQAFFQCQLPHEIVNLKSSNTSSNNKLTILWGSCLSQTRSLILCARQTHG